MASQNYIGTGPKFPVELDAKGSPRMVTGFELVSSSIKMILSWPRNHRIFLSRFGGNLENLMEEPNDELLKGIVEYFIVDSLRTWEKRIKILDITVTRTDPAKLQIELLYKLSNQNISEVITFPFYSIPKAVLIN